MVIDVCVVGQALTTLLFFFEKKSIKFTSWYCGVKYDGRGWRIEVVVEGSTPGASFYRHWEALSGPHYDFQP